MKEDILDIQVLPYDNTEHNNLAMASLACGEGGCDSCDGGL